MARLLITLTVGIVLVAAEAPAAPVAPPPREAAHYFPTTVGAKWVYRWKAGREEGEEALTVIAVRPWRDATLVAVHKCVAEDVKVLVPLQVFEVSDRGLFARDGRNPDQRDRRCLLKLPPCPGQSWGGVILEGTAENMTAHGPEQVEVPAGVFDCLRVEYRDRRDPAADKTWWYARGLGQVKMTSRDFQVVLLSFTPGRN
jgi:hypothetical protein